MKPNKLLTLTASLLLLAGGAQAALNFVGQDVGTPTVAGSATGTGTVTITGDGDDIWNATDSFYYYYTWATGQQWDAYVRVRDLTGNDQWSKCELMIREASLTAGPQGNDRHLSQMTTRSDGVALIGIQGRTVRGGASDQWGTRSPTPAYVPAGAPGVWLRIIRDGANFTLMAATNSATFASLVWYTNGVINTAGSAAGADNTTTFTGGFPDAVTVGVAVTDHSQGDPPGTAVISDLTATFPPITPPSVIGATVQPTNVTAYVGSEATFRFNTTNNANPNIILWPGYVNYQWSKNGTAIAGATSTVYTFLAQTGDNAAQFKCQATIKPPYNTTVTGLASDTAALTVQTGAIQYTNGLKLEVFNGTRAEVNTGSVNPATSLELMESPDSYGGYGDNKTRRLSGWFIPPTTDTYRFFVASDDDADLFLSTDATPANKKIIAQETAYSGMRAWLGGTDTQKRSDYWSDPVTFETAWTEATQLVANQKYYIEFVSHNGGGGDNFSMTYQTKTMMDGATWGTDFTNGVPSIMAATNKNIALITGPTTKLEWVTQPQNISVYEGDSAKWTATVATDSELRPKYQWYKNGGAVAGATGSSYSFGPIALTDNNAEVYVVVKTAEEPFTLTSAIVKLTVLQAVFEKGFAKNEWWWNKTRDQVEANTAGAPDFMYAVPGFEAGLFNNRNDNFANRLSGYFTPASAGAYDFIVCGDDDSDLFLSTDDKPANKRLIAQEAGWSGDRAWNSVGGGSTVEQKHSWTWIPANGTAASWPNGFTLAANTRYYIELVHHDGTGGEDSSANVLPHSAIGSPPADGTASALTGNVLGVFAPRCSYVAFTKQPTSASLYLLDSVTLTADGVTDSTFPVWGFEGYALTNFLVFQWQKNGQDIAGATTKSLTYGPVLLTDNNAQFVCKLRALGLADNNLTPVWSNSATATLTVLQSVWEPGFLKSELWQDKVRADVENNTAGTPTWTTYIQQADQGSDIGANYARKFSGFFLPAATDEYVFYVNADDDADLFLSTDDKPATKRLIAQQQGWSDARQWLVCGGTPASGDPAQKCSATFTNTAGEQPWFSGIHLVQNTKYYFEAVHHEGGGGDNLNLLVTNLSGVVNVVNGAPVDFRGSVIGTYAPKCSYMAFTQQPQSQSIANLTTATFNVVGDTDAITSISPNGPPTLSNKLLYQWYKNGAPIAAATTSKLVLYDVPLADNGAQFVCAIRALGYGDATGNPAWSNSAPAVLTVVSAPATAYASTFTDLNVTPQVSYLDVAFNKRMNTNGWTTANFQVTGGLTVTGLIIQPNAKGVKLIVTGTPTGAVTVTLVNVKDADNVAASTAVVTAQTVPLTCKDVFVPGAVAPTAGAVAYPTLFWVDGPADYTVSAQGTDLWDVADGFNFLYEQKTGDFDVVVRQKSISHTSNWAKGGLMVRETLDANSRNWNIVNTPLAADGIMAPDNSGYGTSAVECNSRVTTAGGTASWRSTAINSDYPNAWVRLTRVGEVITGYGSSDGKNWTQLGAQNPASVGALTPLPAAVYVGICTTAHNNDNPGLTEGFLYYNTAEYADYNGAYIPVAAAPKLSASVSGSNLVISWTPTGGTLQSSAALGGTWTDVGPANPASVQMTGTATFFRVKTP